MKEFLVQFFTWWNGQTLGTRLHTWRYGKMVGQDESGNTYYEGGTDSEGRTRRWVIYNGLAEASRIPPGWHGWMHHRVDVAPSQERLQAARMAKAASAKPYRQRRRVPAEGFAGAWLAPSAGHRRL